MSYKSKSFKWHLLTRTSLIDTLWKLYPRLSSSTLTKKELHRKIYNYLKYRFPIIIRQRYYDYIPDEKIYINGKYLYYLDQQNKTCLELTFIYSSNNTRELISPGQFKRLCITFADTVLHELIHMRQYRRRNHKSIEYNKSNAVSEWHRQEQNYLGHPDEIDAYAFNIACELLDKFKHNRDLIIDYINQNHIIKNQKYPNSWEKYILTFQHDYDNEVIKKLKNRIVSYLPLAQSGKPFSTKKWIDK